MTSGKDKNWKKKMDYIDFEPEPKKDKSLKDFIKEEGFIFYKKPI